jgi:hypothetical protein
MGPPRSPVRSWGALVGRVDRRWRLLAATALPAGSNPDTLLGLLVDRLRSADPARAEAIGSGPGSGAEPLDRKSG